MATVPRASGKASSAREYLLSRIASGEWPVNSRIPREPELMALIGVGKSTLREAVQALTSMGMLEPLRGIGTFVRSRTPVDTVLAASVSGYPLEAILGLRDALEIEGARQAARRRSDEQASALNTLLHESANAGAATTLPPSHGQSPGAFHQQVLLASGNELLRDLYTAVLSAIREKKNAGLIPEGDDPSLRRHDHEVIARAIEQRDASAAADAMAQHVAHDIPPDEGRTAAAAPARPGAEPRGRRRAGSG